MRSCFGLRWLGAAMSCQQQQQYRYKVINLSILKSGKTQNGKLNKQMLNIHLYLMVLLGYPSEPCHMSVDQKLSDYQVDVQRYYFGTFLGYFYYQWLMLHQVLWLTFGFESQLIINQVVISMQLYCQHCTVLGCQFAGPQWPQWQTTISICRTTMVITTNREIVFMSFI